MKIKGLIWLDDIIEKLKENIMSNNRKSERFWIMPLISGLLRMVIDQARMSMRQWGKLKVAVI